MIPAGDEARFLDGALRLLSYLEARRPTGRRFGPDADARWESFRGDLEIADRVELLVRDADAEWPGAVGARTVFNLGDVAEDEPFGAAWSGLDPVDAVELWRRTTREPAPSSIAEALRAIAAAWGLMLRPTEVAAPPDGERLVVAGPSAIAATVPLFSATPDLWAEHVTVVATPPANRQLAAAAAALLNITCPSRLISGAVSPVRGARRVVSSDADPGDTATAARAGGGARIAPRVAAGGAGDRGVGGDRCLAPALGRSLS